MDNKNKWTDDVLGTLIYNENDWEKEDKARGYYNGELREIEIYIRVLDSIFIEYFWGIGDNEIGWTDEDFEDDKEEEEKYYNDVREIYKQYINNIQDTIKRIEKIIIDEYNLYTINENKKLGELEVLADTDLKSITLFDDRIEIDCICGWNLIGGLGIIMYKDYSIVTGTKDILY